MRDSMVWQWFGGTYKDARDPRNFFARFAIEPDRFFNVKGEIQLPEDQKLAFLRGRTACIVGQKLAERLQFKPGDRVTLIGDIYPVTLELNVAGIFNGPDEDAENLFFNYDYLRELVKAAGQPNRDALIFTILLVSGNTMSMAVRERVREVGTLKTIGFTRQLG